MEFARDQALAAQVRADAAEARRYRMVADMAETQTVNTISSEAQQQSRFLSELHRLESEMALQHNRAAQMDSNMRANPASPERVRLAPQNHHLSY